MKLSELVSEQAIVADLSANERDEVIAELVDALIAAGAAEASLRDELIGSILDRESKGSTGFGKGVAVPHVKHPSVQKMSAAVGLSSGGIDFNALDKQPVYSVFLLLSPEESPEEHLQAMEVIFKNLSNIRFRNFLRQAESAEAVNSLLAEADADKLGA